MTPVSVWLFAFLAVGSLASMLAHRPWTSVVARRHFPPEVWATDLFLETNLVMTGLWALLFAAGAALAALAPAWVLLPYGLLLLVLRRRSPGLGNWYSTRRLRAMGG